MRSPPRIMDVASNSFITFFGWLQFILYRCQKQRCKLVCCYVCGSVLKKSKQNAEKQKYVHTHTKKAFALLSKKFSRFLQTLFAAQ